MEKGNIFRRRKTENEKKGKKLRREYFQMRRKIQGVFLTGPPLNLAGK